MPTEAQKKIMNVKSEKKEKINSLIEFFKSGGRDIEKCYEVKDLPMSEKLEIISIALKTLGNDHWFTEVM